MNLALGACTLIRKAFLIPGWDFCKLLYFLLFNYETNPALTHETLHRAPLTTVQIALNQKQSGSDERDLRVQCYQNRLRVLSCTVDFEPVHMD